MVGDRPRLGQAAAALFQQYGEGQRSARAQIPNEPGVRAPVVHLRGAGLGGDIQPWKIARSVRVRHVVTHALAYIRGGFLIHEPVCLPHSPGAKHALVHRSAVGDGCAEPCHGVGRDKIVVLSDAGPRLRRGPARGHVEASRRRRAAAPGEGSLHAQRAGRVADVFPLTVSSPSQ